MSLCSRGSAILLCCASVALAACDGDTPARQPAQHATGGDAGQGGAGDDETCEFAVNASVSEAISTVGVVEWSTTLPDVTSASIEFGLDGGYGMRAPVELGAESQRTLLLGMKTERTYHFRVVAKSAERTCKSRDHTLETGALPNGMPKVTVTTLVPGASNAGFLVSGFLSNGPLFILDGDGDYVWWWFGEGEIGRVLMSYDAQHLWYSAINLGGGKPAMHRVTMDGSLDEDLSAEFGDLHHDFTVLPDETIAYLEHAGELDRVVEHHPNGALTEICLVGDAEGGVAKNHANAIRYSSLDETYTVSDLLEDNILKLTREGETVWVLGGEHSDFTGDGATWQDEHGHQMLGADRLLFFNNGPVGSSSAAVEVALDLKQKTAKRVWEYVPEERSQFFGDVQRLPGGNTLMTISTAGTIHEVDPSGVLVRKWGWDLGSVPGYLSARASLYGLPP